KPCSFSYTRKRSISSPPLAAFRSRRLSRMLSNKGLNSNEALDESTATNSSVTLSGIRREKEAPTDLDIEEYSRNPGNSEPGLEDGSRRTEGQMSASHGLRRDKLAQQISSPCR